jgi:hypothetical protein
MIIVALASICTQPAQWERWNTTDLRAQLTSEREGQEAWVLLARRDLGEPTPLMHGV